MVVDQAAVAVVLERVDLLREMGLFVARSGVKQKAVVADGMSIGS